MKISNFMKCHGNLDLLCTFKSGPWWNKCSIITFELCAFRKSSDMSLITTAVGGRRCISAFAMRLLSDPPCLHKPRIICVALSSRLSNGSLDIKFIRIRRLSSTTSGCFSAESNVRSNDSRCGCNSDKFSDDLSISSIVHIASDRSRHSCMQIHKN